MSRLQRALRTVDASWSVLRVCASERRKEHSSSIGWAFHVANTRVRIVGVVAAVVVVVGANVVAGRDLAAMHTAAARTRRGQTATATRLRTRRAHLAAAISDVEATGVALVARSGERDRLRASVGLTVSALAAVRHDLGAAFARLVAQSDQITVLTTCLQGVSQAMNGLAVGDGADGLGALRAVAGACQRATSVGAG